MKLRKHLTYANVVSSLCLFLALGGVAYAGTKLAKGSVGTEQLKAEAVTKAKLAANSVNSKKVVDGSLTGSDIDAATLGKVPNATDAEHAGTANTATTATTATNADSAKSAATATSANSATNANHADSADSATDADHATSADSATDASHATTADTATNADHATTAASAETLDGVSPDEFGPVLVASAEAEVNLQGEIFFAVIGVQPGKRFLSGLPMILPNRKFRATGITVHLEGTVGFLVEVHVSLLVNEVAEPVCTLSETNGTCTPSGPIEIPAGAQVAWKVTALTPAVARPEFAMRLLPG